MSLRPGMNETLVDAMERVCAMLRCDANVGSIMHAAEHLSWLLFLKFFDQEEKKRARAAARRGETSTPVLPPDLSWDAWAGPTALQAWDSRKGGLVAFVRGRLLPGLACLDGSPQAAAIAGLFSDERVGDQTAVRNVPVCASDAVLKDVLTVVNTIDFERDDHFFALTRLYEDVLARMGQENQIAGEFHTPRPIIRFMVEVIDPQIGETVYDPACGSAGFLAQAHLWMEKNARTPEDMEILQQRTFYGREKKAMVAMLGTMNLILHGVTTPNIVRANTLEESVKTDVAERFDIVLANPPFGGEEGRHIQQNFPVPGNATELLFLQHIIKKLKPTANARAAAVVPEGVLFRSGAFAEVKRMLLDDFHLFAVISLPPGAFAPYSDVKTALLFFRRAEGSHIRNPLACNETWYYELPLPAGLKKFSKGSPILDEHVEEARRLWEQWKRWLDGEGERPFPPAVEVRAAGETASRPYWVETLDDLRARGYDLSARNPYHGERAALPRPAELTARLLERRRDLHAALERLYALVRNEQDDGLRAALPPPSDAALADALRGLAQDDPVTARRLAHAIQEHDRRAALLALLTTSPLHADAVWKALAETERRAIVDALPAGTTECASLVEHDPIAALALAAVQSDDDDLRAAGVAALTARPDFIRAIWAQAQPEVRRRIGALTACTGALHSPDRPAIRRGRRP